MSQWLCLLDRYNNTCAKEHVLFCFLINTSYRCNTSHNKLDNWHADSSRRSIVQRSRERTMPRISSWTSLKCYIHFSFILKLIIFIYKQLKRPVAFSVVQVWHATKIVKDSRNASWKQPSELNKSGVLIQIQKNMSLQILGMFPNKSHMLDSTEQMICAKNDFVPSTIEFKWTFQHIKAKIGIWCQFFVSRDANAFSSTNCHWSPGVSKFQCVCNVQSKCQTLAVQMMCDLHLAIVS